jgi:PHYB activation tagged suppressor 1
VWRPREVARRLRAQGVRGPPYSFFDGNLGDIRRFRATGAGVRLDVADHDFTPSRSRSSGNGSPATVGD